MRSAGARRLRPEAHPSPQLNDAYIHLTSRPHTTFTLAEALGASPATAFRLVKALRRQGHCIASVKTGHRWSFAVEVRNGASLRTDPLAKARGSVRGVRWPRGGSLNTAIDDALYGR